MNTDKNNSISIENADALVLIVDDSSTVRSVVCKYLNTEYNTIQARNGEEAWQLIKDNDNIALVIADLHMPVMNGMQLLKQIRAAYNKRIANTPVIMLTGHEDSEAAKQASYNLGASDFISKPFTEIDIRSRVRSYVEFNRSITTLEKSATTDTLTGLVNDRGFLQQADKTYNHNERHGYDMSVIRLQVVNFADILSDQGKEVADKAITIIASRLQESLRKEEILAHLGQGDFGILLPMTKAFKAHIICMRLKGQLENLIFQLNNLKLKTTIAVGLHSTENDHNSSIEDILKCAQNALEFSMDKRSNNIVRYDEITNDEIEAALNPVEAIMESPDLQSQLDANDKAKYFEAILSGQYEQIPVEHRKALVEPHLDFVRYVTSEGEDGSGKIAVA